MKDTKEIRTGCKDCNIECDGSCGKECEHQCGGCRKDHCHHGSDGTGSGLSKAQEQYEDTAHGLLFDGRGFIETIAESDMTKEEKVDELNLEFDVRSDIIADSIHVLADGECVSGAEIALMATAKILYDGVVMAATKGKKNPHCERYVLAQAKRHLDHYFAQMVEGYDGLELDTRCLIPPQIAAGLKKEAA